MPFIHYDEAKRAASDVARRWVEQDPRIERLLLVADLFGKLRLAVWGPVAVLDERRADFDRQLAKGSGAWWTGEMLAVNDTGDTDRQLWETAWNEGRRDGGAERLRILARHRTRTAWFVDVAEPPWKAPEGGPPIVVFYSFKGGLGRSTTLASFAIQRARAGDRVCVVDFDLDAPGIGRLLAADDKGAASPWGVVDFLVECGQGELPLADYHHSCGRVAGAGQITVFPAGKLDANYSDKLARIDLEERPAARGSALTRLLEGIRTEVAPRWILLDARTGVSEPAGQLLSGIAHLHVLFGTTSEQSWQGLSTVVDRLGRQRILDGRSQAEVVLVQAMVPRSTEAARRAEEAFATRAQGVFTDLYYAEAPDDPTDEGFWDVRDLESEDAPHAPVTLAYDEKLADIRDIADVADPLCETKEYVTLAARIATRFEKEADE